MRQHIGFGITIRCTSAVAEAESVSESGIISRVQLQDGTGLR